MTLKLKYWEKTTSEWHTVNHIQMDWTGTEPYFHTEKCGMSENIVPSTENSSQICKFLRKMEKKTDYI